jgi:hypothetical protein
MGWGRMMLMGNVGQQLDIQDLSGSISEMQNALQRNQGEDQIQGQDIRSLKRENDELKLYLATLVRLLVAKGILRQDEVDAAVRAIDVT